MKKLIIVAAVVSLLSGCTTYNELSLRCANGDQEACATKYNRDSVLGYMGAGMGNPYALGMAANQQNQSLQMMQQNRAINATQDVAASVKSLKEEKK